LCTCESTELTISQVNIVTCKLLFSELKQVTDKLYHTMLSGDFMGRCKSVYHTLAPEINSIIYSLHNMALNNFSIYISNNFFFSEFFGVMFTLYITVCVNCMLHIWCYMTESILYPWVNEWLIVVKRPSEQILSKLFSNKMMVMCVFY